MAQDISRLWLTGGTVTDYYFDVLAHAFHMTVVTNLSGKLLRYTFQMRSVLSFSMTDEATVRVMGAGYLTEPWEKIELSSIVVERVEFASEQYWRIRTEWWMAELEVVCGDYNVTDWDMPRS